MSLTPLHIATIMRMLFIQWDVLLSGQVFALQSTSLPPVIGMFLQCLLQSTSNLIIRRCPIEMRCATARPTNNITIGINEITNFYDPPHKIIMNRRSTPYFNTFCLSFCAPAYFAIPI
ncbi:hypothetical protein J3R30DRAFT_1743954 [Lentinula aciculospora]|uniref:Secreted protein n=1 Tax=Lentinula aciculospora TaxID=153920 RepID=A0A9W9AJK2_9AGAR|nr:hypothetical protein J3R30DRAFT_1743954 [Lentinula aciculospora]